MILIRHNLKTTFNEAVFFNYKFKALIPHILFIRPCKCILNFSWNDALVKKNQKKVYKIEIEIEQSIPLKKKEINNNEAFFD